MIITTCKYCKKTRICDYDGGHICEDCHDEGTPDWRYCDKCRKYEFDSNTHCDCSEELIHACKTDWWDCSEGHLKMASDEADHEFWYYEQAARDGYTCEYCDAIGCSPERHEGIY